jgi:hypothetical protein
MTNDLETLAPRASHVHAARLADIVLDVAVPAMAALLTLGIFLLSIS